MGGEASPEVGWFRTPGGLLLDLHLPLGENLANQVVRGELRRVNPDGTDYEAAAQKPAAPKPNASKNEWVGFAVAQGMDVNDADAMTKNDLIAKFGQK